MVQHSKMWVCWMASLAILAAMHLPTGGQLLAAEEERVKDAFKAFQDAIEASDAAKIWKLLDADSQASTERAARTVQTIYKNADAEGKAKLEKKLGMPGAELVNLTSEGFLKSKLFHAKYHDLPGAKIDKVAVDGNSTIVNYTEMDGDKEKLQLLLQNGDWKVTAPMPPLPK